MRLIDADSLMKKFDPNDVKLLDTIAVRYRIATEETVQPQVIRCKDCRHRDPEDKKCDCGCWHLPFITKDDDFCSYGERG